MGCGSAPLVLSRRPGRAAHKTVLKTPKRQFICPVRPFVPTYWFSLQERFQDKRNGAGWPRIGPALPPMKLLVIEDEVKTLHSIRQGLEEQQWEVDVAYDGTMGYQLATRQTYALIISDIILPGMNGLDLCRHLRTAGVTSPILLLTALGTTDDKITGLDAGADDDLAKPFEFRELLARVRALTRRSGGLVYTGSALTIADLELNPDAKTVTRAGKPINLTAKEFALLDYLLRHQGRVIAKAELAEKIWDVTFDTGTNVIEVYINFLRRKIDRDFEPKLLHTQIGMGYVLKVQA